MTALIDESEDNLVTVSLVKPAACLEKGKLVK